jgi:hypothetical protein
MPGTGFMRAQRIFLPGILSLNLAISLSFLNKRIGNTVREFLCDLKKGGWL